MSAPSTTSTNSTTSDAFNQVLLALGVSPQAVAPLVAIAEPNGSGLLCPAAAATLATAVSVTIDQQSVLQQVSGIPQAASPLTVPAQVWVIPIASLVILAGQTLTVQSSNGLPVFLVVDSVTLQSGGLLDCQASVVLNSQTFTRTVPSAQ